MRATAGIGAGAANNGTQVGKGTVAFVNSKQGVVAPLAESGLAISKQVTFSVKKQARHHGSFRLLLKIVACGQAASDGYQPPVVAVETHQNAENGVVGKVFDLELALRHQ